MQRAGAAALRAAPAQALGQAQLMADSAKGSSGAAGCRSSRRKAA
jgi:hypothetical protein